MSDELTTSSIVRRNNNGFSFVKEVINEVNNNDFKEGVKDFYDMLSKKSQKNLDNGKTYIWTALSAVADDVGGTLYQNVLNYIQNVSDIDTCTVKALQSMIQLLGTKYTVLNGIDSIPQELADLIDVFSMRRECLFNSKFVQQQLVDALSDASIPNEISNLSTISSINDIRHAIAEDELLYDSMSTSISVANKIDVNKLDDFISTTYFNTIWHHLNLTYDQIGDNTPIYQHLSSNILLSGFVLPNKYKDKIDAYKTKWNVPISFNPEEEMKKINAGVSSYDNYTMREQELLDIEKVREAEAKSNLEPLTRYAYFKESKVKEYFKFIEDQYNRLIDSYYDSLIYDVDDTYLDVTNTKGTIASLLNDNGLTLNVYMITAVVKKLMQLTHALQDIREYLKSHAQRTYMKGTFLLISYVINEYLKQNIYPTLSALHASNYISAVVKEDSEENPTYELCEISAPFDTTDCIVNVNLTEYVDQTQYFNIETDNKEDVLSVESLSTRSLAESGLNGKFWEDNNTTNGVPSYIDSTNMFKSQGKSKLVMTKTFSLEQIADFYTNVLDTSKNKDVGVAYQQQYVNDFLTSVFAAGADDSWWHDSHKKVMATLSDQTKTIDIDDYLDRLSAAYAASQYVLSDYTPIQNTTIQQQLNAALEKYRSKLASFADNFYDSLSEYLKEFVKRLDDLIAEFEDLNSQYDDFSTRVQSFIAINGTYIPNFLANSDYALVNLTNLDQHLRSKVDSVEPAIENVMFLQLTHYIQLHRSFINSLNALCDKETIVDVSFKQFKFDLVSFTVPEFSDIVNVVEKMVKDIKFSTHSNFEIYYENVYNVLQTLRLNIMIAINNALSALRASMQYQQDKLSLPEFNELSLELSSHGFMLSTFSLIGCPNTIEDILDYSDNEWYKYKQQLFYKYTGQAVGDTPYYYLENQNHPSYQIHPCLSNFVEKVDFVYPIQSLGSLANDILKQEEARMIDNISDWLSDGYLINVWKNPLNSNSDYLTRYEQASHTDTNLSDNPYFGWDGLIYPTAYVNIEQIIASDFNKTIAGQNFSQYDIDRLYSQIRNVGANAYESLSSRDIKQYGLDWYGNSYILLDNNTLWFRHKNYPIPCIAFAFNETDDNIQFLSVGAFDYVSQSNTWFKNVDMFSSDELGLSGKFLTPKIVDFTFSNDRTILLIDCMVDDKPFTLHGIIKQRTQRIYIEDNQIQNKLVATNAEFRYFLRDDVSKKEYLDRSIYDSWKKGCWFTQDGTVGSIYVNNDQDNLSIGVLKYYKNDATAHQNISIEIPLGRRAVEDEEIKVDCAEDGSIVAAYNAENIECINSKCTALSNTYSQQQLGQDILSAYVDTTNDDTIATYDFLVVGDSILSSKPRLYKMLQPAGFIMATDSLTLSDNGYNNAEVSKNNERKTNGVLKFQLAIPSADADAGIDFRFVCPIRMVEGYKTKATNSTLEYHHDGSNSCSLSGVITSYQDVHFFESIYNQYVATMNDEQFYELTDEERLARKSPNKLQTQAEFDYLQLAHYDVVKHLSAMKSEESRFSKIGSSYVNAVPDALRYAGLAQPFMMISGSIPDTYMSGYYIAGNAQNQNAFKNDRTAKISSATKSIIKIGLNEQIEVSWFNTRNGIKLDFNAKYYLEDNLVALLSSNGDDGIKSSDGTQILEENERNKLNMFLNLDRPGEFGILNTWARKVYTNVSTDDKEYKLEKQNTWFVKNISDESPKFILAKADFQNIEAAQNIAGITVAKTMGFASGKASSDRSQQTTNALIITEDIDYSYISFE